MSDSNSQLGREICDILTRWTWPDHAQSMHAEVALSLRIVGFEVRFEHPIAKFGDDGRSGRIDLVVRHGDAVAAIELDARRPRRRSIAKLKAFDGFRIIGLRGVRWQDKVEGIDAVVCLRSRQATFAELSDRRTVRRFASRKASQ